MSEKSRTRIVASFAGVRVAAGIGLVVLVAMDKQVRWGLVPLGTVCALSCLNFAINKYASEHDVTTLYGDVVFNLLACVAFVIASGGMWAVALLTLYAVAVACSFIFQQGEWAMYPALVFGAIAAALTVFYDYPPQASVVGRFAAFVLAALYCGTECVRLRRVM